MVASLSYTCEQCIGSLTAISDEMGKASLQQQGV